MTTGRTLRDGGDDWLLGWVGGGTVGLASLPFPLDGLTEGGGVVFVTWTAVAYDRGVWGVAVAASDGHVRVPFPCFRVPSEVSDSMARSVLLPPHMCVLFAWTPLLPGGIGVGFVWVEPETLGGWLGVSSVWVEP